MTPAKSKVAETIDEYRGNHLYNRLDDHYRRFAAQVGHVVMWDDHEVRDNWYHAQVLPDQSPYTEKRVAVLAARARQAFLESYPVTMARGADASIYRSIPVGTAGRRVRVGHAQLPEREQREHATAGRSRHAVARTTTGAIGWPTR